MELFDNNISLHVLGYDNPWTLCFTENSESKALGQSKYQVE